MTNWLMSASLGTYMAVGIVIALVMLFIVANAIDSYVETAIPGRSFRGCRLHLHPWRYLNTEADMTGSLPPWGGVRVRHIIMHGEREYRYCPCCHKTQRLSYDFQQCASISDFPRTAWKDIQNGKPKGKSEVEL